MGKLATYKYCKLKWCLPEKNIWKNVWRIDAHAKKYDKKRKSLVPISQLSRRDDRWAPGSQPALVSDLTLSINAFPAILLPHSEDLLILY